MLSGCSFRHQPAPPPPPVRPRVVVIAPVLNLSGTDTFDALKLTDTLASELVSFPGVAAVPVNLTLAALAQEGLTVVRTADEAERLAERLGADATLVCAITEYQPYEPPVVGLVLQLYVRRDVLMAEHGGAGGVDPVAASRFASDGPRLRRALPRAGTDAFVQIQRVYNAASDDVLREVVRFAGHREGHDSPYGWRVYLASQELFARYCCWSAIRTMMTESPRFFGALPVGASEVAVEAGGRD